MDEFVADDDEIVRMDPADDKTGEHKRRALITAAGAAIGAFFGDVFYGREVDAVYDGHYTGLEGFRIHSEYNDMRDRGGVFDYVWDADRPTAHIIDSHGNIYPAVYDTKIYTELMPDGALIGGGGGAAGAFGLDYFRGRMKRKKAEETTA